MLPPYISVKISSEQAGAIALTPVLTQRLTPVELVRLVLGRSGKDANRIQEILRRGTLVAGASRYRWQTLEIEGAALVQLLRQFPDPDPSRPFDPAACREVRLLGRFPTIALTRADAGRRRWLRRRSLWDELLSLVPAPPYAAYSYKDEADVYASVLSTEASARLREASSLAAFSRTTEQLRASHVQRVEFYVTRPVEVR